ncbi:MAG: HDOD domain-containing protein [Deltaproteobacteria bacterium]|nr:HDOD domain-containing protein [Deltaproteobacteria bacterium]
MEKKRVLFVDDEPAILAGLQNLLYKDRRRWEMVFAGGGELALQHLRTRTFDVVVSDMRMPGMDGAALLNIVKDEFPATARIMLSGHAERDAIVRALPALHQLLSKPCDAETLRSAIERGLDSFAGRAASREAEVRAVIGSLDKLPSLPEIYFQLTRAMTDPAASPDDVARIVQRDPALAAKILQLVNSAYFGAGQRTSSIGQAVALLGTDRLRYLALESSVFAPLDRDPIPDLPIAAIQAGAERAAALAHRFLAGPDRDTGFAGALLHDLGRVVLALGMTDAYRAILEETRATGAAIATVEEARLGVDHAEIGACLLGLWGLPGPIVQIVRHHHRPSRAPAELREVCAAVHVADALTHDPPAEAPIDEDELARAGMLDRLAPWCDLAAISRQDS